jgi:hypothetical protein
VWPGPSRDALPHSSVTLHPLILRRRTPGEITLAWVDRLGRLTPRKHGEGMAKRQPWAGPFKYENGSDGKCVKCDAKSKEGGRTIKEAEAEVAKIDADLWLSKNTHCLNWVPVRDRLPRVMEKVLAFDPHMPIIQSARHDGTAWNCEGLDFLRPTHWMPLPPPPAE